MTRLCTLGIVLLANTATAADMPTVAVVGMHQLDLSPQEQERASRDLVDAIEASGRIDALGPHDVAAAIRGREKIVLEEGLLAIGRQNLTAGRNLYNQAQPADAIPILEEAIDDLRLGIAATNTVKDLWEAWLYLGTSHLQLEQQSEADEAFQRAAALNPAREPNPGIFPPHVVEAYATARDTLQAAPVTLSITTDGPATVWVDGEEKGEAPLSLEGFLPGEHHVVARGEGTQAYKRVRIDVPGATPDEEPSEGESTEGESPTVEVALQMVPPTLGTAMVSATGRSRQVAELYTALGTRANGVDLVLLAGTADGLLHLQLFAPDTQAFSKPMEIPYDKTADDEAVQTVPLLLNLVDKEGAISATHPSAIPVEVGTNTELALLLTQPRPPEPVTLSGAGGGDRKRSSGAVIGVVGGVIGAGLIGGTVFALTSGGQEEPPNPNQGSVVVVF